MQPIIKEGVRILTPLEYKQLYDAIPKQDYKLIFSALLHTGMRYVEFQRFQKHPDWFNGSVIRLPEKEGEKKVTKIKKKYTDEQIKNLTTILGKDKVQQMIKSRSPKRHLGRTIILSPVGKTVVNTFLNYCKTPIACGQSWKDNLRRWATKAGIGKDKLSVKTTRKTLACWLLALYPDKQIIITASLGHNTTTALEHYLDIGFKDYVEQIKEHLSGWI